MNLSKDILRFQHNRPRNAMLKIRLRQTFLFLTFIALSACGGGSSDSGGSEADTGSPTLERTKVVAIGDSIGTGFGIATPWPTRLANALGVEVVNNSQSGEQTAFGLGAISGLIESEEPSHVVIMLGTNDAIRGSVPGAINNLQQMVDIANNQNVIAIVATLPPITRSGTENARAAQISSGIRDLSGARIAGVRGALGNGAGLIADGVHPNDRGQQIITDTIANQF